MEVCELGVMICLREKTNFVMLLKQPLHHFLIHFINYNTMNNKEIYENYLKKIKEILEKDDFESLDYILEYMYTSGIPDDILDEIDDILQEVTLYVELKDKEYKETALEFIKEYE